MKIATFRAKCKKVTCIHDFDAPSLSDFNYGEFLYSSIDSEEIQYYSGLDCDTWNFIDKTVSGLFDRKSRGEIGTKIQKIVGLVADRKNPDIYFTQDIYCPKCHSKVELIDVNHKKGLKDYGHMTFKSFTVFTEWEKKELIFRWLREI